MNLISGISSLLAIGILTPVQSILCLIILFTSTAICLYSQGYILMGILYILIYVGAIAILFLFILSLLKIDVPSPKGYHHISPLLLTIIIISFIPLDLLFAAAEGRHPACGVEEINNTKGIIIENIFLGIGQDPAELVNELVIVGNQLYTEYAILLIITGLILILSVIGAISITK